MGETGSDRSTRIPQFLIEAGKCDKLGNKVGFTLSIRVLVHYIANRLAFNHIIILTLEMGSGTRSGIIKTLKRRIKIKELTDGMIVLKLLVNALLFKHSVLIIDDFQSGACAIMSFWTCLK